MWSSLTFSESGGGVSDNVPRHARGQLCRKNGDEGERRRPREITRSTVGTCSEGNATILAESLPWEVTYQSFSGTLPTITGVRYALIGAAFQVEPGLGVVCLARTTAESPGRGRCQPRRQRQRITSLIPDSSLAIPMTGSLACPTSGIFTGTGEVFVQGSSTTRVTPDPNIGRIVRTDRRRAAGQSAARRSIIGP